MENRYETQELINAGRYIGNDVAVLNGIRIDEVFGSRFS
jgi:hypothetical protein